MQLIYGKIHSQSKMYGGRRMFMTSWFLLLCSYTLVESTAHEPLTPVPKWQTVLSDSGIVLPLTGSSAPKWNLFSHDGSYAVPAPRLPSDVITNLLEAGIIGDPYYDRNFLTERHVWMGEHARDDQIHTNRTRTWVYSTLFELPALPENRFAEEITWKLIVEGIKMGAHIELNGIHLKTIRDQFVRYELDLSSEHLDHGQKSYDSSGKCKQQHNLTVIFDPLIGVDGRFAACSGGWDWAPYVRSYDVQGRRSYSFGIVKPMYLIAVEKFYIRHVVPKIYYLGPYPKEPMSNPNGDFKMLLEIHLGLTSRAWSSSGTTSTQALKVKIKDQVQILPITLDSQQRSSTGDVIVFTTSTMFHPKDIALWWPTGLGEQPLYTLNVGFHQQAKNPIRKSSSHGFFVIQKRIAFRTVALVTIDESNETAFEHALLESSEGSGSHGMYYRVNGALLFSRGANVIPFDQLEGRQLDEPHRIAVKSAAAANMNMLRVWGGGMLLPDAFYDACDEFGVLLFHDLMFVDEAGHRPIQNELIELEIRQFVRSLASHPSIVTWNACNECEVIMDTPSEIYASFVMTIVADEDDTHIIWPSSPSKHGWKTGVYTIDGRPNGNRLSTYGPDDFENEIDAHGPYARAFSLDFPGVNGHKNMIPYKNTPPTLSNEAIGISLNNSFTSEFGANVLSSADSMEATISPNHWGIHGNSSAATCKSVNRIVNLCNGTNIMAERNYPCDTHIRAYFGTTLNGVGQLAFREQMFHCMISQALWMKGQIEAYRSKNIYGLLIWQLNENWPTGGWGCTEYGPPDETGAQVLGGRWKPLMHLLENSLFRDVLVACGANNECYMRNDGLSPVNGSITFESWLIGDQEPMATLKRQVFVLDNAIHRLKLPQEFSGGADAIIIKADDINKGTLLLDSIFLPKHPKDIERLRQPISIEIKSIDSLDNYAIINMTSDELALFVVLTCRAQGRFSENAFVLRPGKDKVISFHPMDGSKVDVEQLRTTIRVEHLGLYLVQLPTHHVDETLDAKGLSLV